MDPPPPPPPPLLLLDGGDAAGAEIVVACCALLLPALRSTPPPATVTWAVFEPADATDVVTVTVTVAPAAIDPGAQLTPVPLIVHVPCVEIAALTFPAAVRAAVTAGASSGPLLRIATV